MDAPRQCKRLGSSTGHRKGSSQSSRYDAFDHDLRLLAGPLVVWSHDPSAPEGCVVDMEANLEAALARIMAAASDRPPAAADTDAEGKGQERS